ncbi:MAG: DUF1493 family protein [Rhizomicrobium sp.]
MNRSAGLSRDRIREELQAILRRIVASNIDISELTEIFGDLGIAGDDAWDFISEIRNSFGTRFDGFNFNDYFQNEEEALMAHIGRLLGFCRRSKKKLTICHLIDVVQNGAWFE